MPCCGGKSKDLDTTYECHMKLARSLKQTMRRPEDQEFTDDIIRYVEKLHKSGSAATKTHNNVFLHYFVKVLHTNCETQPLEVYDLWYRHGSTGIQTAAITRIWLEEEKSYFAMEKTADGGILFYSAVATDIDAGWDKGGLKNASTKLCL